LSSLEILVTHTHSLISQIGPLFTIAILRGVLDLLAVSLASHPVSSNAPLTAQITFCIPDFTVN